MARVVKEAEVRREELLELALGLFMTLGYERTSVERITRKANVAKGTFYHYFDSKQDLLEQLTQSYAEGLFVHIETALGETEGDAVAKLRALSQLSTSWKLSRWDETVAFGRMLFVPENLALRTELYAAWFSRMRPIVSDILEQGRDEGVFAIEDAFATAGVIISLWFDWGGRAAGRLFVDGREAGVVASVARDLLAGTHAQERILGVAPGSLTPSVDVELVLTELVEHTDTEET